MTRSKFKNKVLKSRFFVDFMQIDGKILEEWEFFAESISDLKAQIDEVLEPLREELTNEKKKAMLKNIKLLKKEANKIKGFQYINFFVNPYITKDQKLSARDVLKMLDDFAETETDKDLTYTPSDPLEMRDIPNQHVVIEDFEAENQEEE